MRKVPQKGSMGNPPSESEDLLKLNVLIHVNRRFLKFAAKMTRAVRNWAIIAARLSRRRRCRASFLLGRFSALLALEEAMIYTC